MPDFDSQPMLIMHANDWCAGFLAAYWLAAYGLTYCVRKFRGWHGPRPKFVPYIIVRIFVSLPAWLAAAIINSFLAPVGTCLVAALLLYGGIVRLWKETTTPAEAQGTVRTRLRAELTRRFVPLLHARGYVGPEQIAGNAIMHDFTRPSPKGLCKLGIQFEKKQKPRFILNLTIIPPENPANPNTNGRVVIAGRACPGWGVFSGGWFRADRPWWQWYAGMDSTVEERAVTQVIGMLDEIEDWWQNPRKTKNIHPFRYPYN